MAARRGGAGVLLLWDPHVCVLTGVFHAPESSAGCEGALEAVLACLWPPVLAPTDLVRFPPGRSFFLHLAITLLESPPFASGWCPSECGAGGHGCEVSLVANLMCVARCCIPCLSWCTAVSGSRCSGSYAGLLGAACVMHWDVTAAGASLYR